MATQPILDAAAVGFAGVGLRPTNQPKTPAMLASRKKLVDSVVFPADMHVLIAAVIIRALIICVSLDNQVT